MLKACIYTCKQFTLKEKYSVSSKIVWGKGCFIENQVLPYTRPESASIILIEVLGSTIITYIISKFDGKAKWTRQGN